MKILNQPGWDYKISREGVSIFAPTEQDATTFAQDYASTLSETAAKIHGKVQICSRHCNNPIEFHGWMAPSQPLSALTLSDEPLLPFESTVFSSQFNLPATLLRRMVAAAENPLPVSIVRQHDHKQIMINQPMSHILATPPEIATQRCMTRFWLPEDFARLQQQLRTSTRFTWIYSAGLNEQTWAILHTHFELFESEGIWYRQGTCLASPQIVPIPPGAFASA